MPKLKSTTILPTPEEDAAITAAALSDPDARPFTEQEWQQVRPVFGQAILRLDVDVLERLKAIGPDWQSRANDALRAWLLHRA